MLDMPKGSLLKQKRLHGEIKVVNSLDSLASGICQNPFLAFSLLTIMVLVSRARILSTLGMG